MLPTKDKITMYVGLPKGKLGVMVKNGIDQNTGYPTIIVSSVDKKSKVKNILKAGDNIISLNGCNVVPTKDQQNCFQSYEEEITLKSEEEFYEEGPPEEHECDVVKDYTAWFQQMLRQTGKTRYLLIERSVDELLDEQENQGMCNKAESVEVKASSGCLGIVVRGRKRQASWPSSRRYRTSPLWISHVFDSSELSEKVFVGNEITHLNGHLLSGILPAHFAEMMQDIGDDEDRIMTVEQLPTDVDLY